MNLRQIEILRALIRYNTTVAAAQALGLSQPAISNAIKVMEDQAGFSLFERHNNRLYPTSETRLLLEDVEAIFDLHERFESRIKDLRESRAGQLRVVATPPIGHGLLTRTIGRMQFLRPRVRTYFDIRRYEGVLLAIERHQAELGFLLGYTGHPGIASEELLAGEMVCVMHPAHPLAQHTVIEPADLRTHRLIALERGTKLGDGVRNAYEQCNEPFNFSCEVRYSNSACALAESNVGVAIVDPLTARSGHFNVAVVPFRPAIAVRAYAVWSDNRSLSRLGRYFMDQIRQSILNGTDFTKG